jgi:hypothetical protein
MITSRTRAFTLLAAAFVLGGVAGGIAMRSLGATGERDRDRPECDVRHPRVCRWASELQLTTEQQEGMLQVYRDAEARMDSIYRPIHAPVDSIYQTVKPRVDSLRVSIREMIRPLLTPVQREKYDSVNAAYDENRRRDRERSPNGGPPRGRP